MKLWRIIPGTAIVVAGILMSAGSAGASPQAGKTYDCTGAGGGVIPAGTYGSMIVTGVCYMPAGAITIRGNLAVAPDALLDAATPGDPVGNPLQAAQVDVGGNVSVAPGAVLILGCSPHLICPNAVNDDHVGGKLTATGALGVVLHSVNIGGNVSFQGGGNRIAGPAACGPAPAPWSEDPSLDGVPVYSDAEDDAVGGSMSVVGLKSCWLGTIRNRIGGSATFVNNKLGDPDANEILDNLIGGDMICYANVPAVQFGDGAGAPDVVGGLATGQCGPKVLRPNPAPEAMEGPGVMEHITVSALSLGTTSGTHIQTSSTPVDIGPSFTASGDFLVAEMNTDVITGTGLTGPITETFLATIRHNDSLSFFAVDTCGTTTAPVLLCSYDGHQGTTTIYAYGHEAPHGLITGTFLIASGGTSDLGLAKLAGYGTFTSAGVGRNRVHLVEHLEIS